MNDFEKALEIAAEEPNCRDDDGVHHGCFEEGARWAREWVLENNNPKVYESGWNSCLEHFQLEKLHTENQGLKAELKDCNDDQDWALNRIEKLRTSNKRLREALEELFGGPCIGSCKTDKQSAANGITVYCFKCNTINKALAENEVKSD